MNHTPGPWEARHSIAGPIAEVTGADVAYILEGVKTTNVSDAHLIAAAPETKEQRDQLLEALELMVEEMHKVADQGPIYPNTLPCVKAHAAIAKARGE